MREAYERSSTGWNNILSFFCTSSLCCFHTHRMNLVCILLGLARRVAEIFWDFNRCFCSTWRHLKKENFQDKEGGTMSVNTHLSCSTSINVHGLTLCGSEQVLEYVCCVAWSSPETSCWWIFNEGKTVWMGVL